MKLIDGKAFADEILGEIFERGQASGIWEKQVEIGAITYRDIEYADGYDNALEDIYRRINNAPTVKAIPVEWIKKYIKQNYCPCDLVYPKEFLKELVTWWREDENEYKENTSQTD